ncbi:hypothetical protein EOK75_06630 [Pseudorhodobacter turbinis]|uniref:Uncharacterized protein n=1 Tax=Pseudorhodobacter turbinis TaxID=2500533 RepID=A0A4P8EF86_9RHOB|nr:hypothetical protein [Pseudorhodobacter turbinis]QCO55457.1 hypothetical protein EOK75_06630 [Pseudorhodobacter turbinis]
MTQPLWAPGAARIKGSLIAAFMEQYCPVADYDALWSDMGDANEERRLQGSGAGGLGMMFMSTC